MWQRTGRIAGRQVFINLTGTLSGPKSFVRDLRTEERRSSGVICVKKKLFELKGSVGSRIGLELSKEEVDTKWVLRSSGDIVI